MDHTTLIIASAAMLAGFLLAVFALLRGWNGWLALKRDALGRHDLAAHSTPSPAARIELADLKERIRRLEAIANGVE